MKKLIAATALSFCATLSAMERPHNTIILKTPTPQVLRKALKNSEQTPTKDSKLPKISTKRFTKLETRQTSKNSWVVKKPKAKL